MKPTNLLEPPTEDDHARWLTDTIYEICNENNLFTSGDNEHYDYILHHAVQFSWREIGIYIAANSSIGTDPDKVADDLYRRYNEKMNNFFRARVDGHHVFYLSTNRDMTNSTNLYDPDHTDDLVTRDINEALHDSAKYGTDYIVVLDPEDLSWNAVIDGEAVPMQHDGTDVDRLISAAKNVDLRYCEHTREAPEPDPKVNKEDYVAFLENTELWFGEMMHDAGYID